MTKAVLFSSENLNNAKKGIAAIIQDFLKVEPKNSLAIPETKKGAMILDQAFTKLEALGYSAEDSQHLISEVVEMVMSGGISTLGPLPPQKPRDDNF